MSEYKTSITENIAPIQNCENLVTASRRICSWELLGKQEALYIQHQDELYILRKTRAGKLILTK